MKSEVSIKDNAKKNSNNLDSNKEKFGIKDSVKFEVKSKREI